MKIIFIIANVLVFSLVVWALIKCFRSKTKTKILWIIFILFGFFKISLNWSTDKIFLSPLGILFFGISLMKNNQGGQIIWIMSFAIPLGAIIWLIKSRDR